MDGEGTDITIHYSLFTIHIDGSGLCRGQCGSY